MESRITINQLAQQTLNSILAYYEENNAPETWKSKLYSIFRTVRYSNNIINTFEDEIEKAQKASTQRNSVFLMMAKNFVAQAKLIEKNEKLIQENALLPHEIEKLTWENQCLEEIVTKKIPDVTIIEHTLTSNNKTNVKTQIHTLAIDIINFIMECYSGRIFFKSDREKTVNELNNFLNSNCNFNPILNFSLNFNLNSNSNLRPDDESIIQKFNDAIENERKISDKKNSVFLIMGTHFLTQANHLKENQRLTQINQQLISKHQPLEAKNRYLHKLKKQISPTILSKNATEYNQTQSSLSVLLKFKDILSYVLLFVDIEKVSKFMIVSKDFYLAINTGNMKKNREEFFKNHIHLFFDKGPLPCLYAKPTDKVRNLMEKYQNKSPVALQLSEIGFIFNHNELNELNELDAEKQLTDYSITHNSRMSYGFYLSD